MPRTFTLALFVSGLLTFAANAQTKTPPIQNYQPYGVIDTADLSLKQCDFEKDANAEVLFNKGIEAFDDDFYITFTVHKRIKIFTNSGKDEANIRIPFIDKLTDLKAETINLNGKTITYTPIDANLFYKQKLNQGVKEITFAFPEVRPGSVIELQYKWRIYGDAFPRWYFQEDIPTRYSEINVKFTMGSTFSAKLNNRQPLVKDSLIYLNGQDASAGKKYVFAMANVPAFKDEPYPAQESTVRQRLLLRRNTMSWGKVFQTLYTDPDLAGQLGNKLPDEADLLKKLNAITDKDARTDSAFVMVQKHMLWNKQNDLFSSNGIHKAWNDKTGNSTDINLILCRLLRKANLEAYPMPVSTPDYGAVDLEHPSMYEFNKTVVYMPIDSTHYYILDASDKHNVYNIIPFNVLSTYGLEMNVKNSEFKLFKIASIKPSTRYIKINADILPAGKVTGDATIINDSYSRNASIQLYRTLGEKKYIDELRDHNNNLNITSLKLDSAEQDSVPLTQHIKFNLDLIASDDNYIYFDPNLFTTFGSNPFLSPERNGNIDFIFANSYILSAEYKIPDGYKVGALPNNIVITMKDKSMSLTRIMLEENNHIIVNYRIIRRRSYYGREEYDELFNFYKQIFTVLNDVIVFKKS